MDVCLSLAEQHRSFDPQLALEFFIKFSGLAKQTPRDRILRAIAEELSDLAQRAQSALAGLPPELLSCGLAQEAGAALQRSLCDASEGTASTPAVPGFPRAELEAIEARARRETLTAPLALELRVWIDKHCALEQRIRWLLNGTPKEVLQTCDAVQDCDRIFHAVSSAFRIESRVLELLSINRISQSSAVSLFFRSTREAETNGVQRFHDTWSLVANFFEWGEDSKRGRETAERMRQIHGRYYIPNAGMKYVLLETAFTFLDGADRLGHRPLLDVERRGYFHAYVKLGLASNIGELSHDYDEMYGWYRDFNRANSNHQRIKTETFEALVGNSMGGFILPGMKEMMFTASRVGMDDEYLAALNYPPPTASERSAVRAVFFTLGQTLSRLPYTPFIRSLQNNPAKNRYTGPGELGVNERSKHLPSVDAAEPNGGFPEQQRPILSDADVRPMSLPVLSWEEVARHNSAESLWVVINGEVYDLTVFAGVHPGGLPALLTVAGKDATRAFETAPHSAATRVFKLNYRIGRVAEEANDGRQRS